MNVKPISFLVALFSTFSFKAQAFENEELWAELYACKGIECLDQKTEEFCGALDESEQLDCETAGGIAKATFLVETANSERADRLERELAEAKAQLAAKPTVVEPQPVPQGSASVVSSTDLIPLGPTPGQSAVYLSKPEENCGEAYSLQQHGENTAYVVYVNGSELPAHVKHRAANGEWVDSLGSRVDLNGDGRIDPLTENNVELVKASNRSLYSPGNYWDEQITLEWINFRYDKNWKAWRPVRKGTIVLDFKAGENPRRSVFAQYSDF